MKNILSKDFQKLIRASFQAGWIVVILLWPFLNHLIRYLRLAFSPVWDLDFTFLKVCLLPLFLFILYILRGLVSRCFFAYKLSWLVLVFWCFSLASSAFIPASHQRSAWFFTSCWSAVVWLSWCHLCWLRWFLFVTSRPQHKMETEHMKWGNKTFY